MLRLVLALGVGVKRSSGLPLIKLTRFLEKIAKARAAGGGSSISKQTMSH